jgi:tetratricopeptide (TPR) repeat protein
VRRWAGAAVLDLPRVHPIADLLPELHQQAVKDPDPAPRLVACEVLGRFHDTRTTLVLERACLDDPDEGVRRAAARSLRHLPDNAPVDRLRRVLGDGTGCERWARAAAALGELHDDAAVPELGTVAEADPSASVRLEALVALSILEERTPSDTRHLFARLIHGEEGPEGKLRAVRFLSAYENWRERGEILGAMRARGAWNEVLELAAMAAVFRPSDAWLHSARANAYHHLGDVSAAIAEVSRAAELQPDEVYFALQHSFILAAAGSWNESVDAASRAVALECDGSLRQHVYCWYGWCLYVVDRLAPAEQALREAQRLDPSDFMAGWRLGLVLLTQGQREEAVVWLQQSAQLLEAVERGEKESLTAEARSALDDLGRRPPELEPAVSFARNMLPPTPRTSPHRRWSRVWASLSGWAWFSRRSDRSSVSPN